MGAWRVDLLLHCIFSNTVVGIAQQQYQLLVADIFLLADVRENCFSLVQIRK